MAQFMNKFKNFMLGAPYEESEEDMYDDYQEEYEEEPRTSAFEATSRSSYSKRNSSSKIVNIHTNIQMEVVVTTPESIEEAGEVCDYLKSKKTVVVNLEKVEHETAQRISDFLCGACYSLDGSIQMISDEIFIIGPVNVDISGNFKDELQANGIKLSYASAWK